VQFGGGTVSSDDYAAKPFGKRRQFRENRAHDAAPC